jgi:glutathione S-transferase
MTAPLVHYIEAFWVNPWDCSVYVTLREKGLPFSTSVAIVQGGMGLVGPMRDLAVTGRVPALQHGDFWISESLAIIEYLESTFPPPEWPSVFPAAPRERARARQIMTWLRTELWALRRERWSERIFYPAPQPPLSAEGKAAAEELLRVAQLVGAGPSGRLFATPCVADVDLAFTLKRLVCAGDPVPAPLVAFAEAVWARPSVRAFVEHQRPPHAPTPQRFTPPAP